MLYNCLFETDPADHGKYNQKNFKTVILNANAKYITER